MCHPIWNWVYVDNYKFVKNYNSVYGNNVLFNFFLIKSDLLDKCSREVFQIFFEDLFILIYIDSTPEVVSNPFWNYLALCLCHAVCPEFFLKTCIP